MPEILFIGTLERVNDLEIDENPADVFPCMSNQGIHIDARAQLYTLVTNLFLADALEYEPLVRQLSEEGPNIYQLDDKVRHSLGVKNEQDIEELAELWLEFEDVEALEKDKDDLIEFLYQFVHFCQTAGQDEELGIYIYADG